MDTPRNNADTVVEWGSMPALARHLGSVAVIGAAVVSGKFGSGQRTHLAGDERRGLGKHRPRRHAVTDGLEGHVLCYDTSPNNAHHNVRNCHRPPRLGPPNRLTKALSEGPAIAIAASHPGPLRCDGQSERSVIPQGSGVGQHLANPGMMAHRGRWGVGEEEVQVRGMGMGPRIIVRRMDGPVAGSTRGPSGRSVPAAPMRRAAPSPHLIGSSFR